MDKSLVHLQGRSGSAPTVYRCRAVECPPAIPYISLIRNMPFKQAGISSGGDLRAFRPFMNRCSNQLSYARYFGWLIARLVLSWTGFWLLQVE